MASNEPTVAPYGTWRSPIDVDLLTAGSIRLGGAAADGDDVYWSEGRAAEAGRVVLVRRGPDGRAVDLTPPGFNARTRVHEYGGGAWAVRDGSVVFSNFADNRLYRQSREGRPHPVTERESHRFADLRFDSRRNRVIAVREDHSAPGEAVNTIVAVSLPEDPAGGTVLVSGSDFYASPRLSPDGGRLVWLSWNHPNMPWDGCELWEAEVRADGGLGEPSLVAGGPKESIFQPEWSPDGDLWFVSDHTGWWNLYRRHRGEVDAIAPEEAEYGRPQWVFGMSTYAFADARTVVVAHTAPGGWGLSRIDARTGVRSAIGTPWNAVDSLAPAAGTVLAHVGSPTAPDALVRLDPYAGTWQTLRVATETTVDPGYVSVAEAVDFPTEGGLTAHGYLYLPRNKDYAAPAGERPPLLVQSHGGPTGGTSTALDLEIQFWTSRGFAVLDVDYGGSTGYGRAYRERLEGVWGIVDVDDCVNGAKELVRRGLVDPERVAVRGWSASGYLTLAALAFRDFFKAGVSHFGISDLETMAADTHKFESRYLDGLIGPYPAAKQVYEERSPINFVGQVNVPLALFQGEDDKIVPPDQAEKMHAALAARGVPTSLVVFPGEGHGFRQAQNIRVATEGELSFYGQVFGFAPAGEIATVEIVNLPAAT